MLNCMVDSTPHVIWTEKILASGEPTAISRLYISKTLLEMDMSESHKSLLDSGYAKMTTVDEFKYALFEWKMKQNL